MCIVIFIILIIFYIFFSCFFQAEDGIRDRDVTGVQTCALPISPQTIFFLGLLAYATSEHIAEYVGRKEKGLAGARVRILAIGERSPSLHHPIGCEREGTCGCARNG